MFTAEQTVIVAGNGPSLAQIPEGTVGVDDRVLRTNSFFLEPRFFLGPRVDLVMIAGDPRVSPFLVESMHRCRDIYEIKCWSAVTEPVIRAAKARLPMPYVAMPCQPETLANEVARLSKDYNATPTSGIQLLLLAYALGARKLNLVGIDLYAGPTRYAFDPGPRMRRLLGQDLGSRGWDARLHHPDLDRRVLELVAKDPTVRLRCLSPASPLAEMLPLAEPSAQPAGPWPAKPPVSDWVGRTGFYPLFVLDFLRRARRLQRRLLGK